jgi:hypothetical protein
MTTKKLQYYYIPINYSPDVNKLVVAGDPPIASVWWDDLPQAYREAHTVEIKQAHHSAQR